MNLTNLDLTIIIAFFAVSLAIGLAASRKAGKGFKEFFLIRPEHALVATGCFYGSHDLFGGYP
jgi:hypothetical protein